MNNSGGLLGPRILRQGSGFCGDELVVAREGEPVSLVAVINGGSFFATDLQAGVIERWKLAPTEGLVVSTYFSRVGGPQKRFWIFPVPVVRPKFCQDHRVRARRFGDPEDADRELQRLEAEHRPILLRGRDPRPAKDVIGLRIIEYIRVLRDQAAFLCQLGADLTWKLADFVWRQGVAARGMIFRRGCLPVEEHGAQKYDVGDVRSKDAISNVQVFAMNQMS